MPAKHIFEDRGMSQEEFEREVADAQGKHVLSAELLWGNPLTRKYRLDTEGERTQIKFRYRAGEGDEKPIFMRGYRANSPRKISEDLALDLVLYKSHEADCKNIKDHWHTASEMPEQRRTIPLFSYPITHDHKNLTEKGISLTYFSTKPPLDERISEIPKPSFETLNSTIDLYTLLFDRVPQFTNGFEKIAAQWGKEFGGLKELRHDDLGKGQYKSDYTKSLMDIIKNSRLSDNEMQSFIGAMNSLAKKYLAEKESQTVIHAEAWPWHNNASYILDNKGIAIGSRGITFGHLFGFYDIFLKFAEPEKEIEMALTRVYPTRRNTLEAQFNMGLKEIDYEALEKSFYIGAVCANFNLLARYGDKLGKDEPERVIKAVSKQLEILSKKDYEAEEPLKIISGKKTWDIYHQKSWIEKLFGA